MEKNYARFGVELRVTTGETTFMQIKRVPPVITHQFTRVNFGRICETTAFTYDEVGSLLNKKATLISQGGFLNLGLGLG